MELWSIDKHLRKMQKNKPSVASNDIFYQSYKTFTYFSNYIAIVLVSADSTF